MSIQLDPSGLTIPAGITLTSDGDLVLPAPVSKMPNLSATAMTNFRSCKRLWWFQKVAKIGEVAVGRALVTGIAVHDMLEIYLKGGHIPDPHGGNFEAIAYAGLHLLPDPNTVGVEDWVTGMSSGPLPFKGKVDMYDLTGNNVKNAGWDGLMWIGDHKTSSDPNKWGKTPEELAKNPQLLAYAYGLIQGAVNRGEISKVPDAVAVSHVYYKTRGRPEGKRVDAVATWSDAVANWDSCGRVAHQMHALVPATSAKSIAPNRASCGNWGGCPMAGICFSSPRIQKQANMSALLQSSTKTVPGGHTTMSDQNAFADALFGTDDTPAAAAPAVAPANINPPDSAPELNETGAMIKEAATFISNTLSVLPQLPLSGYRAIMSRVGLSEASDHAVLTQAGAGFTSDGEHIAPGLEAPPALEPATTALFEADEAGDPKPTTEATAPTNALALTGPNAQVVEAIYSVLQSGSGTMTIDRLKTLAKELLGISRIGSKRVKQITLDGELANLFSADEDNTTIEIIGGGSTDATEPAPAAVPATVATGNQGVPVVDHLAELGKLRAKEAAAAEALNAIPGVTATVSPPEPAPAVQTPQSAQVVYVDCRPDSGAVDFALWVAPIEEAATVSAGQWVYSMDYAKGPPSVAAGLIRAIRDGLKLPPALHVSTAHPAASVCLPILAQAGASFVRAVR
jgi:hypothetical protein